jgi:hypothetical protein
MEYTYKIPIDSFATHDFAVNSTVPRGMYIDRLTATLEIIIDKNLAKNYVIKYFSEPITELIALKIGNAFGEKKANGFWRDMFGRPQRVPIGTVPDMSYADIYSRASFEGDIKSLVHRWRNIGDGKVLRCQITEFEIAENYCYACGQKGIRGFDHFCGKCGHTLPQTPFQTPNAQPQQQTITIPDELRDKHIYMPGKPGQGKTTAMLAYALEDINQGRGLCFIDPAGDAIKKLIHWIPENRKDDAIELSPRRPIPIDFMAYDKDDPLDKERLVGDLMYVLEKNPENTKRMAPLLRNVLYTILDSPDRTFLDIHHFFEDPERQRVLKSRTTPDLQAYWKNHPPKSESVEALLNRINIFVRVPTLRTIFDTPNPELNISDVMESGKILLVDLDDSEAGKLLGQLIVTKIKQTAFRRRDMPESERPPFCLYCALQALEVKRNRDHRGS